MDESFSSAKVSATVSAYARKLGKWTGFRPSPHHRWAILCSPQPVYVLTRISPQRGDIHRRRFSGRGQYVVLLGGGVVELFGDRLERGVTVKAGIRARAAAFGDSWGMVRS